MDKHTEEFKIEGMTCGHCVAAVKRALEETDGVEIESVDIGVAVVSFDANSVNRATIAAAIEDAGYAVAA